VILVAGRYEGIDERIVELEIDEEWSVGDYVLSGGEFAALTMIDAVTRCCQGHWGTRNRRNRIRSWTACWIARTTRGLKCTRAYGAEVLLGGNHEAIRRWRLKQALGRTQQRRPELLQKLELTAEQSRLLQEFIAESPEGAQREQK